MKEHINYNRLKTLQLLFCFLLLFILISCSENEIEIIDPNSYGFDYYPVEIGRSWTFKTDSILYKKQIGIIVDTTTSFLREEVTDSFRNAERALIYRIDIFHTPDTNLAWEQVNSYFIQKDDQQIKKTENGLQYIKLVFPVRKNKSWSGNSAISPKTEIAVQGEILRPFTDNWFYNYKYTEQLDTIGERVYNKVCLVSETDDENLLEKRFSIAKYARGIGPVYKEQWLLDTQDLNASVPFERKAERGMILRQFLVSYK